MRILATVCFVLCFELTQSQSSHSLFVYYPIHEEFSFDSRVQNRLHPSFGIIRVNDKRKLGFSAPFALGGGYSYAKQEHVFSAHVRYYGYINSTQNASGASIAKLGDIIAERSTSFQFDYGQILKTTNKERSSLLGVAAVKYRHGATSYHDPYTDIIPSHKNRDIGVSLGIQWRIRIIQNLFLYADIRCTRWLFIYHHHFGYQPKTFYSMLPRNSLDGMIGFGYTFNERMK